MRVNFGKDLFAVSFGLLAAGAGAALTPVSPVGDASVARVPDAQKAVMALPTLNERVTYCGQHTSDPYWGKPLPLVLKFNRSADEIGPWKVLIGKSKDLSDARRWYFLKKDNSPQVVINGNAVTITVPQPNLELGTRYYWQVESSERCNDSFCPYDHDCAQRKRTFRSPIASFVTEENSPRWIEVQGDVGNIRDLGGRIGLDGKQIRQGILFRGQGLNDNSVSGEEPGDNRLTVEDVKYLKGTLGIKTDLDLRAPAETAGLAESPLGPEVTLLLRPSDTYAGIFAPAGMAPMAENFRDLADPRNYPIYIHCISGADRTGSLVYMLYGILGVSEQEALTDWEATFYPYIPNDPTSWKHESHFANGLAKYGEPGDPWSRKVELYLKDCGVTDSEIAAIRENMLYTPEPPTPPEPPVDVVVAVCNQKFWLAPDEFVEAFDEVKFALLVFRDLPENPTEADIAEAINASGAVDKSNILKNILGADDKVAAYRDFRKWADKIGALDVAKSQNAGASFALGTETLFQNAPKAKFTSCAANELESGALDVAVTVKDGEADKPVSSAKVAGMFEATTDVTDWDTPEKQLEPQVTDRTEAVATPVEFTVKPGDGTAPNAFLRIRH